MVTLIVLILMPEVLSQSSQSFSITVVDSKGNAATKEFVMALSRGNADQEGQPRYVSLGQEFGLLKGKSVIVRDNNMGIGLVDIRRSFIFFGKFKYDVVVEYGNEEAEITFTTSDNTWTGFGVTIKMIEGNTESAQFVVNRIGGAAQCTDSDGGIVYSAQGTTCGSTLSGQQCGTDLCQNPNTNSICEGKVNCLLKEHSCSGNNLVTQTYNCPNGCRNGACISATACAEDAKQCPDGRYVSRVPPNCDFPACSNTPSSSCGNGQLERNLGEECDGTNIGGRTCAQDGYTGGTYSCTGCSLDAGTCLQNTAMDKCYTLVPDNNRDQATAAWSKCENNCFLMCLAYPNIDHAVTANGRNYNCREKIKAYDQCVADCPNKPANLHNRDHLGNDIGLNQELELQCRYHFFDSSSSASTATNFPFIKAETLHALNPDRPFRPARDMEIKPVSSLVRESGSTLVFYGRVLDGAGRPIAGAKVYDNQKSPVPVDRESRLAGGGTIKINFCTSNSQCPSDCKCGSKELPYPFNRDDTRLNICLKADFSKCDSKGVDPNAADLFAGDPTGKLLVGQTNANGEIVFDQAFVAYLSRTYRSGNYAPGKITISNSGRKIFINTDIVLNPGSNWVITNIAINLNAGNWEVRIVKGTKSVVKTLNPRRAQSYGSGGTADINYIIDAKCNFDSGTCNLAGEGSDGTGGSGDACDPSKWPRGELAGRAEPGVIYAGGHDQTYHLTGQNFRPGMKWFLMGAGNSFNLDMIVISPTEAYAVIRGEQIAFLPAVLEELKAANNGNIPEDFGFNGHFSIENGDGSVTYSDFVGLKVVEGEGQSSYSPPPEPTCPNGQAATCASQADVDTKKKRCNFQINAIEQCTKAGAGFAWDQIQFCTGGSSTSSGGGGTGNWIWINVGGGGSSSSSSSSDGGHCTETANGPACVAGSADMCDAQSVGNKRCGDNAVDECVKDGNNYLWKPVETCSKDCSLTADGAKCDTSGVGGYSFCAGQLDCPAGTCVNHLCIEGTTFDCSLLPNIGRGVVMQDGLPVPGDYIDCTCTEAQYSTCHEFKCNSKTTGDPLVNAVCDAGGKPSGGSPGPTGKPIGADCTGNFQCTHGYCEKSYDSTTGKVELCRQGDSGCKCGTGPCVGGTCVTGQSCDSSHRCGGVESGKPCGTQGELSCKSGICRGGICVEPPGATCSNSNQCASNTCNQGKCGNMPQGQSVNDECNPGQQAGCSKGRCPGLKSCSVVNGRGVWSSACGQYDLYCDPATGNSRYDPKTCNKQCSGCTPTQVCDECTGGCVDASALLGNSNPNVNNYNQCRATHDPLYCLGRSAGCYPGDPCWDTATNKPKIGATRPCSITNSKGKICTGTQAVVDDAGHFGACNAVCPGESGGIEGGAICGDGQCNNGEDCNSCSGDCGTCGACIPDGKTYVQGCLGYASCPGKQECDSCGNCNDCAEYDPNCGK